MEGGGLPPPPPPPHPHPRSLGLTNDSSGGKSIFCPPPPPRPPPMFNKRRVQRTLPFELYLGGGGDLID